MRIRPKKSFRMIKLKAQQLRISKPSNRELEQLKRNPITIIIDNVLDTYNIGSIFRLADAVAAEKIYLCGKTATPPYHRIQKASVGTWAWVPWEYCKTAKEAILSIKQQVLGIKIIAVEQHQKSVNYTKVNYRLPAAFVVGHESEGVSKEVLELADGIVEIPMFGVNSSLNVMVSLAIVMYKSLENLN